MERCPDGDGLAPVSPCNAILLPVQQQGSVPDGAYQGWRLEQKLNHKMVLVPKKGEI